MNLLLRFFEVLALSLGRPKLGMLDTSTLTLRVWPNDLDLNFHMNNGRYLSLMDLGRLDLTVRLGLVKILVKRRWQPLVGSATIRYRRALQPFETYRLHTRVLCWDEKWIYFEQRFEAGGQDCAVALVKAVVKGRDGNVAPADLAQLLTPGVQSPPMPANVATWIQSEKEGRRLVAVANRE